MNQDFSVSVTAGTTVQTWMDPARPAGTLGTGDLGASSRLNSIVSHPELRYVGVIGTAIFLRAKVAGVVGPYDGALGGRLFTAWRVENPPWPGEASPYVFGFTSPAGQSSVQSFTPEVEGHYTIGFKRTAGGIFILHFDVGGVISI